MPLFDFKCADCSFRKEHFVAKPNAALVCPQCNSSKYSKQLPHFSVNVEYSNVAETVEKKINPFVRETQEKIGREALDFNTKTLDNIYGDDKVKKTFYEKDD